VPLACRRGHPRVDLIQVSDNGVNRCEKAVEIEPMETDATLGSAYLPIPCAQPFNHLQSFLVPPHPGWKPGKSLPLFLSNRSMAYVLVDPRGIGPVRLDRDKLEAFARDQVRGDSRSHPVELRGSVGCLSQQYEASIADPLQQRLDVHV